MLWDFIVDHERHGGSTYGRCGARRSPSWYDRAGLVVSVLARRHATRRSTRALFFLVALAGRAAMAAEPMPSAGDARAEHEVTPPEPVSTPIAYPEGETRRAEVALVLELDRTGHVTAVEALSGTSPFRERALEAARGWRFRPALRDGVPVAARYPYTVRFEPPSAPEKAAEAPAAAPPGATAAAPAAPPAPPLEVVVRGERTPLPSAGSVTLTREEAGSIPGTFGDPLRAVEAQPGVVPIVSGLPQFFVRGAPPANVGFFIDGIDVPLLYHAFFGPSVIHPGLIESVTLHGGAPPVRFGRYAGPVVSTEVRPLERRLGGEASVRTVDAGVLGEVPFGGCDGADTPGCQRGSVRLGGRYSYTGLILSLLGDAKLDYWDYLGQAGYRVGKHDEIGLLGFGAFDHFEAGGTGQQGGGEVAFHRVDLRWDRRTTATRLRVGATFGYDSTGGVEEATSLVRDKSLRLRATLQRELAPEVTLEAGIDGRLDDYELETDPLLLNFADYSRLFPSRTETSGGAYVAFELTPVRGIRIAPGIRTDVYHDRGVTAVGVNPRVSAEVDLGRYVTVEESVGMAHQRPNFVPQVPGAQVADLPGGLQEALLASSGVRVLLPADFKARATVFENGFFHTLDPLGSRRDFTIDRTVLDRRTTIRAAGLEFKLERPIKGGLGGFLSYTLSHSVASTGREESVTGFDRPHVAQLALGYDFGSGYTAGGRAIAYSGVPELNLERTPHFTDRRRGRPYFRLDLRAQKRFRLGEHGYFGVIAEVLNATSTSEVVRLDCGERCAARVAGPVILPSIGVEAGL